MTNRVRRIFVEKKKNCAVEAQQMLQALREDLGIHLENLRIIHRYDMTGISEEAYQNARNTIFAEPPVDHIYDEELCLAEGDRVFAIEYLPGQYDQRADSAAQCLQILIQKERPDVQAAKVIVLQGSITEEEFIEIKKYCINPVDSREASLEKPESLELEALIPEDIMIIKDFNDKSYEDLSVYKEQMGFAMTLEDLAFCQDYFKNIEKRNPTITELKVIDTYWSDHCRHTTFLTEIEEIQIEKGAFSDIITQAYDEYLGSRDFVYGDKKKDVCLMDIATMGMKELRKKGKLEDLDISDEINACSIVVKADVNGQEEDWLVMFKNETHNHPTEIEPFGGAATCLGGAIRDPLSGRTYVYQAMRVTGSGDPRTPIEDTLAGKLPQRKITTGAAAGYSSYGNQIGLATGQVAEIYDEGFVAKRMEIGAVIAAAPKANVVRKKPQAGDVILLVGGKTGRDGCGGATGSSKEHTEDSILTCGAEVQKGNAPTERKIQRLFRNPLASQMIKKCNDFGAGGVSVAIGELADGLEIYLDAVPKKYEGLDGTELAISESQERMAVVVSREDVLSFIDLAQDENLEAVEVASVTGEPRLKMIWRGKVILDISRDFLDTNGVKQKTKVFIKSPREDKNYFHKHIDKIGSQPADLKRVWLDNLQDLNICSQKGLVERFDSTIGTGTVLMPFGGTYQSTPSEAMVAKLPVMKDETMTGTIMSYGYNPKLSTWSPFHGAFYGVIEAVAKVVALGGDYKNIRLTLQEYFEKLGKDPEKWGKPFSALLGAFYAQKKLGIPAIGGKDSMSGTFKDLNVPPTLVTFAVNVVDVNHVVSQEFKGVDNDVIYIPMIRDVHEMPDFERLEQQYEQITRMIQSGRVLSSHTIRLGGIAAAVSKMTFGNRIGITFGKGLDWESLFAPDYGGILLEIDGDADILSEWKDLQYQVIGKTSETQAIAINGIEIPLKEAQESWEKPLEKIFPTKIEAKEEILPTILYQGKSRLKVNAKIAKPRIFIPVFPGTNCEYDSIRAFEKAGGQVETLIFKNLSAKDIEASIEHMTKKMNQAQIVMLPGGFSAGDEPDGSGKFIATAFRNPRVKEAVMKLLKQRDGLMLGICNGFQALIKLGLLPYGEIRDMDENSPTLTYNKIGRHASCMVHTKVVSNLSPWMQRVKLGEIHTIPISHGEGRFIAGREEIEKLLVNGQIATQYVDLHGNPTYEMPYNPNGSMYAVEGITSPDGRILGKMGHSERVGSHIGKNVLGEKEQRIFESGVAYFRD
ncbi:MAG: phosphoribosylformylglycinamidine synthase [Anaerosolibacter sp.]|uniref:phosphoribosylformylglycinamidine synthase n=1 Tax=Anaerosolibacter sp. TaxID=1872527 RepID=UPI00260F8DC1|nr:phosphoribosylformylglycinamidine synthase [Anaerosolibacter sp.]MDF2546690.1 phosphoribosylformylglycinamidine synthase [Anaerosolibacter sp.]